MGGFFIINYGRTVCMGAIEIVYAAFFCFAMVFALLGSLYVLVKLSTGVIRFFENKVKNGRG